MELHGGSWSSTEVHGGSVELHRGGSMELRGGLHGGLHGGSWSFMELRGGLHGVLDNVGRRKLSCILTYRAFCNYCVLVSLYDDQLKWGSNAMKRLYF